MITLLEGAPTVRPLDPSYFGALAAAQAEIARRCDAAEAEGRARSGVLLVEAALRRDAALEAATPGLLALALDLARAVVGALAETHHEVALESARRALAALRHAARLLVRVAARDHAAVSAWAQIALAGRRFEVIADPSVRPGGIVLETEQGRADAQLETQLHALEVFLRDEKK